MPFSQHTYEKPYPIPEVVPKRVMSSKPAARMHELKN